MNNLFPILETFKTYSLDSFRKDILSGLIVGIVLVPQGMAYAVIAGLEPIYGLYAGLVPLIVYPFFSQSKQLAIGPVAVDMLILSTGLGLIAGADISEKIYYAILITSCTGLIQLIMGGLRLGIAFNLISRPVISGFIIAAPVIIIASQLSTIMGLQVPSSQFVYEILTGIINSIEEIHVETIISSLLFLAALILLRLLFKRIPSSVIVMTVTLILVQFINPQSIGLKIIGGIPEGLPEFKFQMMSLEEFKTIFLTSLTLALVQFMTVASLSKSYARKKGHSSDPNQELIAVGSANFIGSMFQSPPVSVSFSRSAIADETGTASGCSNIFSAVLIGLTLLFLTPVFESLPKTLLSSIIVVSVWGLIDFDEIKYLYRVKTRDAAVAAITFLAVILIGIQEGIVIGISFSVLALLVKLGKPTVAELGLIPKSRDFRNKDRFGETLNIPGCLILRVDASFSFVNAAFFKKYILNKSNENNTVRFVILDGTTISDLDISAMESLDSIIESLRNRDIKLYISGLIGPVRDVLNESEYESLQEEIYFPTLHDAVKKALKLQDVNDNGTRLDSYLKASN